MTTSGSINYVQNRNQIITDALSLIGVVSAGGTATASDITFCSDQLNKMVKGWQALGINLWKECEAVLFLVNDQNKYSLSSTATDKMGDNPVVTETTAAASSSATTLTVTSTAGMTAADNISISLDANTRHHTTIVSVDSSTALTITSGLASAAASGSSVVTYTTRSGRPLNITNARYRYLSGVERRIKKMGRAEFMALPNKSNNGTVTAYYYSPQLGSGLLYVWQTPDNVDDILMLSYIKSIEDFDASTDDPDFPQEWYDCITRNLAVKVAPAYGLGGDKSVQTLMVEAKMMLDEMRAWDSEEGSIQLRIK